MCVVVLWLRNERRREGEGLVGWVDGGLMVVGVSKVVFVVVYVYFRNANLYSTLDASS